jgi:hypothetical protein
MYPESIRRLGFGMVTFIDEGLLVPHLTELEFRSVLELGISIPLISSYCLFLGSRSLESVFDPWGNVE